MGEEIRKNKNGYLWSLLYSNLELPKLINRPAIG
jgi:hypothetical protein